MTDDEVVTGYRTFSDEELRAHRDASLRMAESQMRFRRPLQARMCRERAELYDRALMLRGYIQ